MTTVRPHANTDQCIAALEAEIQRLMELLELANKGAGSTKDD